MMKKNFSIVLVFILLISTNSLSIEPDIFVQSTVNRASKLLGEDISKNEKIEKLKSMDLYNMTPIDVVNYINDLRKSI